MTRQSLEEQRKQVQDQQRQQILTLANRSSEITLLRSDCSEAETTIQALKMELDRERQVGQDMLNSKRRAAAEHEKEVTRLRSASEKQVSALRAQIWDLEGQLRLERAASRILSPGEAAQIMKVHESNIVARNAELDCEVAMLRHERECLVKDNDSLRHRLECEEDSQRATRVAAARGGA